MIQLIRLPPEQVMCTWVWFTPVWSQVYQNYEHHKKKKKKKKKKIKSSFNCKKKKSFFGFVFVLFYFNIKKKINNKKKKKKKKKKKLDHGLVATKWQLINLNRLNYYVFE